MAELGVSASPFELSGLISGTSCLAWAISSAFSKDRMVNLLGSSSLVLRMYTDLALVDWMMLVISWVVLFAENLVRVMLYVSLSILVSLVLKKGKILIAVPFL